MSQQKVGCLFSFLKLLGLVPSGAVSTEALPYRVRDDFLSAAERSFYGALLQACDAGITICPKVRIADVLFVIDRKGNQGHANRIQSKHVDFLLCAADTMRPLAAIELDDRSHERSDRKERDTLVDAAFEAAGLPLIRFAARAAYSVTDVASRISDVVGTVRPVPAATVAVRDALPICPKCGIPMVERTAKQGGQAGKRFYGCRNYPRCRETRQLG